MNCECVHNVEEDNCGDEAGSLEVKHFVLKQVVGSVIRCQCWSFTVQLN